MNNAKFFLCELQWPLTQSLPLDSSFLLNLHSDAREIFPKLSMLIPSLCWTPLMVPFLSG